MTELQTQPVGAYVMPPRDLAAITCLLSRFIAVPESRHKSHTSTAQRALARYARASGQAGPELPVVGYSNGETALYRLGISDEKLRAQWRQAEHEAGLYAVLPQEIIEAFISPAVWPALHQLLLDGPEEAHRNCLRMVDVEAQRHVPPNKRRPQGGTLSNATLIGMDAELRRLMTIAMFLRQNGHRGALFVAWTWVARQPLIRPGVRQVMRFTPTIPVARAAWAHHRDDPA